MKVIRLGIGNDWSLVFFYSQQVHSSVMGYSSQFDHLVRLGLRPVYGNSYSVLKLKVLSGSQIVNSYPSKSSKMLPERPQWHGLFDWINSDWIRVIDHSSSLLILRVIFIELQAGPDTTCLRIWLYFSKLFVHMSCMWMRDNREFVQVAVKGALTQLVQKVVENLLVASLYCLKGFVLTKEVDHFEQRNYPWDIWHILVVLILEKIILKFILPK